MSGLATAVFAAPAFAQETTPTGTVTSTLADGVLDSWVDIHGRPTAKVTINGQGPFQFLVDTGSAATVIAERHVAALDAYALGKITVMGATGEGVMPLVELSSFQTGVVTKADIPVVVLPDKALGREDGIIGADVFTGRRLVFDLRGRSVRIETSARKAPASNVRIRDGQLAEIAGRVGNVPTRMMLDTGAKSCIANRVLTNILERRYPAITTPAAGAVFNRTGVASIFGVTGQRLDGKLIGLPMVDVRAFTVEGATCIAADAPIFGLWGLADQPAMIVGVDLLSRLESFSIDYGARMFAAKLAEASLAHNAVAFG